MSKVLSKGLEFQAFIKFLARGADRLCKFYGPSCENQPNRIALAAAKEWDGFSSCEKRCYFDIHLHDLEKLQEVSTNHRHNIGSFTRYASINRGELTRQRPGLSAQDVTRILALQWNSLQQKDKKHYSDVEIIEWKAHNLLMSREKLKKIYTNPDELRMLELILNSRPRYAKTSYSWFLSDNNLPASSKSSLLWKGLSKEQQDQYKEKSRIDRLRYKFELSLWKTKLLTNDYLRTDLKPSDFSFESVLSLEDIDNLVGEQIQTGKRPTFFRGSPFTFFYKDFRSKNKNLTFDGAIKVASQAWHDLPEESKEPYRRISREKTLASGKAVMNHIESGGMGSNSLEAIFKHIRRERRPTQPSQLIKRVIPAHILYLKDMKGRKKMGLDVIPWANLDDRIKNEYKEKTKELKEQNAADREELSRRVEYINILIKKSNQLRKDKIKLKLISKSKHKSSDDFDDILLPEQRRANSGSEIE